MENIETYRGEEYNCKKPHLTSILNKNNKPYLTKKKAFTLAEVLITLAIIGIVAALTIPSLVVNYQKKQYVTQLKKEYNQLNNGLKAAMANDGVTKLSETKLLTNINGTAIDGTKEQGNFSSELKKIFKIAKIYELDTLKQNDEDNIPYSDLNGVDIGRVGGDWYTVFLTDGTVLYLSLHKVPAVLNASRLAKIEEGGGKLKAQIGEVWIDVNGVKEPNVLGRDLFGFAIDDYGTFYPYINKDVALYYHEDTKTWKDSSAIENCTDDLKTTNGEGCAARIMEEGWEMNY